MSTLCNRKRFRAAAVYAVVGVTLTGWSSAVRAAPLLPSGLNAQHTDYTKRLKPCIC
jgi:hypothetical protein